VIPGLAEPVGRESQIAALDVPRSGVPVDIEPSFEVIICSGGDGNIIRPQASVVIVDRGVFKLSAETAGMNRAFGNKNVRFAISPLPRLEISRFETRILQNSKGIRRRRDGGSSGRNGR